MSETREHGPGSSSGVSNAWLERLGFETNPFALREATLEEQLDEYFVEPPGFEHVSGPHTFLLFAARGGGKTACRIMVEHACRPHDSQSAALARSHIPLLLWGNRSAGSFAKPTFTKPGTLTT